MYSKLIVQKTGQQVAANLYPVYTHTNNCIPGTAPATPSAACLRWLQSSRSIDNRLLAHQVNISYSNRLVKNNSEPFTEQLANPCKPGNGKANSHAVCIQEHYNNVTDRSQLQFQLLVSISQQFTKSNCHLPLILLNNHFKWHYKYNSLLPHIQPSATLRIQHVYIASVQTFFKLEKTTQNRKEHNISN